MRIINRYSGIIVVVVFLLTISANSLAGQFKVTGVTDGDTVKIADNGVKMKIRLVGIDAPETSKKKNQPGQPFSKKSTSYLADLVLNKSVEVKSYGTDRYGRTLGVVFVGEKNVNLEIVKAGMAEVYRGRPAGGLNLEPYWKSDKLGAILEHIINSDDVQTILIYLYWRMIRFFDGSATNDDEKIDAITKNLSGRGQSRPRKVKTLANTINSLFTKKLQESELMSLVKELEMRKYIIINQDKVSYKLP